MSWLITVPFSNTGEHHGIINKLTEEYKIDLLAKKIVKLKSSGRNTGEISTIINHGTGHYQPTSNDNNTYIQTTFLKGFVYPTGYTLKGTKNAFNYAKSWYVYGIHEGDEDAENKWDLLAINDTSQSTYCAIIAGNGNCNDDRVGSFDLKPLPSLKGYKHLRWKVKEPGPHYFCFLTAGIDVYGTLSFVRNAKPTCFCRYNKNIIMIVSLIYSSSTS